MSLAPLISKTKVQLAAITDDSTDADKTYMEDNVHQYLVDITSAMLSNAINVKDYAAVGDGVADDSTAITNAIAAAGTKNSRVVIFPAGTYKILSQIDVNVFGLTLLGAGYSDASINGRSRILKNGSYDALKVSASSITIEGLDVHGDTGNGGDGITVEASRCVIRDVSCRSHGGVGIRIGRNSNNNNLWRLFNVLCLANTSHGLYIHDDGGAAADVNAGCAYALDLRDNGGDGLRLENALDNQFYGLHAASNTGYGINMLSGSKGHSFFFPYLELNTAGAGNLASGAEDNFVWGVRQGVDDGWTIGATSDDNVVLGRSNSTDDMFMVLGNMAFEGLNITDHPHLNGGLWSLKKDATTRNLEILKRGGSDADVIVGKESGGSGTVDLVVREGNLTITAGNLNITAGDIDINGGDIIMEDNRWLGIDANNGFLRDGTNADVTMRGQGDLALIMDSDNNESNSRIKFMINAPDPDAATEVGSIDESGKLQLDGEAEIDGDLNHDGSNVGFYGTAPVAQQTGVAVSAAAIHAALVSLGLITA